MRIGARAALASLAGSIMLLAASTAPAASTTYTTFQAQAEGCSGGGDTCGTFPLVRSGDAEQTHSASSDGTVAVSATAEGGLPRCIEGAGCMPALGQYHAEAVGSVWIDVVIPDGTTVVRARTAYRLDALSSQATATVGGAQATAKAVLSADDAPGAAPLRCSDGGAVLGRARRELTPSQPLGDDVFTAEISCDEGTTLSGVIRVDLTLRAGATSDGGRAEAHAGAIVREIVLEMD